MLRLQVARRLGAFSLEAGLELEAGETMVVVGESGSGKTSLLRMVAGLLTPDRGRIEVDGELWYDDSTGVSRPACERPVGHVAQDYALFPHLTVSGNVGFGLRAQGLRGPDLAARVASALERLGIGALGPRRPHELSGGQQQRVALARAIVLEPRVLLLDEPLSALDVQTRRGIRGELRRLLAGLPCATLLVTHSPSEALAFGERILVLEAGRVTQQGPRDELMRRPRTPYVAEFLGVNLLRVSRMAGGGAAAPRIVAADGELALAGAGEEAQAAAIVHPHDITLSLEPPGGTARNVFSGPIEELLPEPPAGALVRVRVGSHPPLIAEVTAQAVEALRLAPGVRVYASFKATGVHLVE